MREPTGEVGDALHPLRLTHLFLQPTLLVCIPNDPGGVGPSADQNRAAAQVGLEACSPFAHAGQFLEIAPSRKRRPTARVGEPVAALLRL